MTQPGTQAPEFTAPLVTDEIEPSSLSDHLSEGPIVLAFFPGAYTSVCTHELKTFQEHIEEIESSGAKLFAISVDLPFALRAFRDDLGLSFGLFSDSNRDIIEAYGLETPFTDIGVRRLAKRAVFVLDRDGTIHYRWVGEHPGVEPDYEEVMLAVKELDRH